MYASTEEISDQSASKHFHLSESFICTNRKIVHFAHDAKKCGSELASEVAFEVYRRVINYAAVRVVKFRSRCNMCSFDPLYAQCN